MQQSKYFDNQIIKPENLEFQRDSTDKNIVDNFLTFTKQTGGIVTGLTLSSGVGTDLNISFGFAYDNSGQRIQAYSGVTISATAGSNIVWASLKTSELNPDTASPPSYNSFPAYGQAQMSTNPNTGSGVAVSNFNTIEINQISGTYSIPLGLVTVSGGTIVNIEIQSPYRQPLKLLGVIDVETSSLDGSIIGLGTIDSDRFTNPLSSDFYIGSGVNILPTYSGTSKLGTTSIPFLEIDTKNLNVTNISGLSPINIKSDLSIDGSASISTKGSSLSINPSGQDTYIGDRSYSATPGKLYVNNLSAWDSINPAATMNLSAGKLNMILDGVGGSEGLDILLGGDGARIHGGNTLTIDAMNNANIFTNNHINLKTTALNVSGNTVELSAINSIVITTPLTSLNGALSVGSTATITSGISTQQSFTNLIPNSQFMHSSGAVSYYPQIWTVYSGAGYKTTLSLLTSSSERAIGADSALRIRVSGLTGSPGTLLSIPVSDYEDGMTYSVSYSVSSVGLGSTTNSDSLVLTPYFSTSPTLAGPIWYNTSQTLATTYGTYKTFSTVIGPVYNGAKQLVLKIVDISSQPDRYYDIDITNIKVTKGKGTAKVDNNNMAAWTYSIPSAQNLSANISPTTLLSSSNNSTGQIFQINVALSVACERNGGSDDYEETFKLYIDGVEKATASNYMPWQLMFNNLQAGKKLSQPVNLTWAGYLSPGTHTFSLVGISTSDWNHAIVDAGNMSVIAF